MPCRRSWHADGVLTRPFAAPNGVMTRAPRADGEGVNPRALALLASCASPIFMAAAIAAWLLDLWPATPATLCMACLTVLAGPMLGHVHAATAKQWREDEEREPEFVAAV